MKRMYLFFNDVKVDEDEERRQGTIADNIREKDMKKMKY